MRAVPYVALCFAMSLLLIAWGELVGRETIRNLITQQAMWAGSMSFLAAAVTIIALAKALGSGSGQ